MNPWQSPGIAAQQRALADEQLATDPWPIHFTALAEAVKFCAMPEAAIIEVGCGVGQTVEILRRAEVPFRQFAGADISQEAIALARERYPDHLWSSGVNWVTGDCDIAIDGSCILHVNAWLSHLAQLCLITRRWVVLHRIPIFATVTRMSTTRGYGNEFPAWEFRAVDILIAMATQGFAEVAGFPADGGSSTLVFKRMETR